MFIIKINNDRIEVSTKNIIDFEKNFTGGVPLWIVPGVWVLFMDEQVVCVSAHYMFRIPCTVPAYMDL